MDTIWGIQYDCFDSKAKIRNDLEYKIENGYFYVLNGVTGYEGLTISDLSKDIKDDEIQTCWVACMGTFRRYHRLEIPISELRRVLKI